MFVVSFRKLSAHQLYFWDLCKMIRTEGNGKNVPVVLKEILVLRAYLVTSNLKNETKTNKPTNQTKILSVLHASQ